ncbi:hypothetical protein [Variovorax sp. dw_954]|uniref:hypothetical protein n=1 Tax=Variovorax sp. dw_954 TaxID=2720078 RepID=UPI001BD4943D|nr:hypothetical protein [Variovorax sp. dw_954]
MSIPVNARVRAVPNFVECLRVAKDFMEQQDVDSASARFRKLQAGIVKARSLISFAPNSGRPARFLDARSGWGQFQAGQARQLARELGMPSLRELVLDRHVMLYAHSDQDVVLLSLRHER